MPLSDSGDPGNLQDAMGLGQQKPERLTDATWQHLNQRYKRIRKIDGGGQALVFEAEEQTDSHRRVALKVYRENTDEARRLFQRECHVLALDDLPQDVVVSLYHAVNEPDIQPYLVLEYIDGWEIHKYVKHPHAMSVNEKIDLFEKFLRTLHRLHDRQLVFGDLAPKNVLVQKGDVIRFIDMAGAKRVTKEVGTSQSSANIGTPDMMPDAWREGVARSQKWTDIYCAAAIGFLIFTGQTRGDVMPAAWDQELLSNGVPSAICKIIRKGLREPDAHKISDPSLYSSAEDFANALQSWRVGRAKRKQLLVQSLVMLTLLIAVSAVGAIGWMKYREEQALRKASAAKRDLEWAAPLRESLGEVLNKSPWLSSSKAIQLRKDQLAKRFLELKGDLDAGRTDNLQPRFAELHAELAKLADENTQAGPAAQAQSEYRRAARSVSERLRQLDGFVEIDRSAKETQRLLDEGKWRDAVLQFGFATQRLIEWLEKNETPGEFAARQKAAIEIVASLEEDKRQLKSELVRLTAELEAQQKTIVDLAKIVAEETSDRTERTRAESELKTAQLKLAESEGQLATASKTFKQLEKDSQSLVTTRQELQQAKSKLEIAEAEIAKCKDRAETLVNQAASREQEAKDKLRLKPIPAAQQAAKLQQPIVKPKDWKSACEALLAAAQACQAKQAEKQALLTNNVEGSPKIVAINQQLAVLQQSLEEAAKNMDQADQREYEQLEKQIQFKQQLRQRLLDVNRLPRNAAELQRLRVEIDNLKTEQRPYKAGSDRANGTGQAVDPLELAELIETRARPQSGGQAGELSVVTINDVEFAFRWCPPGKFMMGSPADEKERSPNEDQVLVELTRGFAMLETEVTQAMWAAVINTRPWQGNKYNKDGANYTAAPVNWNDATVFCQKLTETARHDGVLKAGEKFSLPTEAQWEYAARAGTETEYFFGNDAARLGEYAWYSKNAWDIGEKYAHQVGQKKPNSWGLLDLTGNVWEWCEDWYADKLPGGTDPLGPATGTGRCVRGGSFRGFTTSTRVAKRYPNYPTNPDEFIGFRVARVVE